METSPIPSYIILLDYLMNVTESVLKKLKRDFKENQKEAVKFICDCFDNMLDDDGFIAWLVSGAGYKARRLKQILKDKKPNKRNSKFTSTDFQEIYNFWLDNSINSNESAYNMKHINKRLFQMSSRRECSLKTVRRLFLQFQGWYTPSPSINYIQVFAKSLQRSKGLLDDFLQVQAIRLRQINQKRKAKLLVHQLSQPTPLPSID